MIRMRRLEKPCLVWLRIRPVVRWLAVGHDRHRVEVRRGQHGVGAGAEGEHRVLHVLGAERLGVEEHLADVLPCG